MKNIFYIVITVFILSIISCTGQRYTIGAPLTGPVYDKPIPPVPGYIWIGGDWVVKNGHYIWHEGYWHKPKAHKTWLPGHWVKNNKGWYWKRGRWQ